MPISSTIMAEPMWKPLWLTTLTEQDEVPTTSPIPFVESTDVSVPIVHNLDFTGMVRWGRVTVGAPEYSAMVSACWSAAVGMAIIMMVCGCVFFWNKYRALNTDDDEVHVKHYRRAMRSSTGVFVTAFCAVVCGVAALVFNYLDSGDAYQRKTSVVSSDTTGMAVNIVHHVDKEKLSYGLESFVESNGWKVRCDDGSAKSVLCGGGIVNHPVTVESLYGEKHKATMMVAIDSDRTVGHEFATMMKQDGIPIDGTTKVPAHMVKKGDALSVFVTVSIFPSS